MHRLFFYFLLYTSTLSFLQAAYFANPADPSLLQEGFWSSPQAFCNLRVGYLADDLYQENFKEEFPIPNTTSPSTRASLSTTAATITLNLKNHLDLTAILGSSQLQIDQEIFTKRQFSWGVGGKLLIYSSHSFFAALDLKYFSSEQTPLFFLSEGSAYNVLSDFKLQYTDMQAALGLSYKTQWISPYLYLSYLYSKIEPVPYSVIVQIPYLDKSIDTTSRSVINQRRWGMAVGATLLAKQQALLTLESRFFNQNALSLSAELRF